jgi:hypothetical protein
MEPLTIPRILDLVTLATALLAAWFWYRASTMHPRRVRLDEEIDAQDINRLVTAMRRSAFLNRRAALASAASAGTFALKMMHDVLVAL